MILYWNNDKRCIVTASNSPRSDIIKVGYADVEDVELHVVDGSGDPVDLSAAVSWRGAMDLRSRKNMDDPMTRLLFDDFDLSDAAAGIILYRRNCYTDNYRDRAAKPAGVDVDEEIIGMNTAGENIFRVTIPMAAFPITDPAGGDAPAVPDDYAAKSWVIALWSAGMAVQFSVDGETPLDVEPEGGATWYRIRPASYGGAWSVWMRVPRGETGTAATVTVVQTNTLAPGSAATVTEAVDSTAQVRKLIVGIPSGVKGDIGLPGPIVTSILDLDSGYVQDATWGGVGYLDSIITTCRWADWQRQITKLKLTKVSLNPAVTGNVVLKIYIGGTLITTVTVAVGATASSTDIELSGSPSGILEIVRDTADAADTLDDVTCVVLACEVYHA